MVASCCGFVSTIVRGHLYRLVVAGIGSNFYGFIATIVRSHLVRFVKAVVGSCLSGIDVAVVRRCLSGLICRTVVRSRFAGMIGCDVAGCPVVTSATIMFVYLADGFVVPVVCVAVVDREAESIIDYCNRVIEVSGSQISSVLPSGEYPFELALTAVPEDTENVGSTHQAYEVIVIDLIYRIVLCVGEIELISHLVGEEERFCLCSCVAHCIRLYKTYGDCDNCKNKLFHGVRFLKV